jgi:hypothetical protein
VNPLASTWFSTIAANDNIEYLTTRVLPSQKFVEAMRKEFSQALLDSAVLHHISNRAITILTHFGCPFADSRYLFEN